jgi:NADPH:quinone reductase-like Zn-dependent oxidoreductase
MAPRVTLHRESLMTATIAPPSSTGDYLTHPAIGSTSAMRAVVQTAYGGPDRMSLADIARPEIGPREVLVQVRAAGLDRGTWHMMRGEPYLARLALGLRAPKNRVPGLDLAGTVVAVGAGVTRFGPGDEVFGIGRGSYAEFAAAREDKLALKPPHLRFGQAAAVPVSGLTALQGVVDTGKVQAGQRVLITGASGGVGSYAVQIAKAMGADVTAVCSAAKMDFVESLGADRVLDYARDDGASGNVRYHLVLAIGGNAPIGRLRRALDPRGTLVVVGGEGGDRVIGIGRQIRAVLLSPFVRQRLTMLIASENHVDLERLARLMEQGAVAPAIDRRFPLDEVPDAMRYLEAGRARGKIVIAIA